MTKNNIVLGGILLLSIGLISATIDLNNLFDYSNQTVPIYIQKDNTNSNPITDEGATLGRVLFYDKKLSSNNTVSCSSCHQQEFAFSDTALVSQGVNGTTGRHSMRLINARFGNEEKFFWDERAATLEEQTSMPIQDHAEMGYSGTNGDPDINDLVDKLDTVDYYNDLFFAAFGDTSITEERIQFALAQFVRSIQSFDSKFDVGLVQVPNPGVDFPNYTTEENLGKTLFLDPPNLGGAGCAGCHQVPEFDIDPNSLNNAVTQAIGGGIDSIVTRAPTLRDVVDANGNPNGPFMHNGIFTTLDGVINHYDQILPGTITVNTDPRLTPGGNPQNLGLNQTEKDALVAFLETLTGTDVYTNEKWSDPFDSNGDLDVIGSQLGMHDYDPIDLLVFPNPVVDQVTISGDVAFKEIEIMNANGQLIKRVRPTASYMIVDMAGLPTGIYLMRVINSDDQIVGMEKIIKH
jgi:cytochrome c peroxidase